MSPRKSNLAAMVGLWVREVVNSVALTRLELNNMTESYTAIWTLLLSCVSLCTAPATIAQDPIRVETKEVLVPVFVIDNARYQDLRSDPKFPANLADKLPRYYVPLVSNNIEFKVTGNTQFKKGEILYAYFEVL